jgi:hypothetical protein
MKMDEFLQIDWRSVFFPSVGVAEIFLRGTIVYFFLFFILRLLRREAGAIGISDLLLVVRRTPCRATTDRLRTD